MSTGGNVVPFSVDTGKGDGALKGDGGGGTFDGMEERISRLEGQLDRIDGKLDAIGDKLGDLRVDLAKKPTSTGLWGMIATVIGVALAIAFGTFTIAQYVAETVAK